MTKCKEWKRSKEIKGFDRSEREHVMQDEVDGHGSEIEDEIEANSPCKMV